MSAPLPAALRARFQSDLRPKSPPALRGVLGVKSLALTIYSAHRTLSETIVFVSPTTLAWRHDAKPKTRTKLVTPR
jgi:hypothetical protein